MGKEKKAGISLSQSLGFRIPFQSVPVLPHGPLLTELPRTEQSHDEKTFRVYQTTESAPRSQNPLR